MDLSSKTIIISKKSLKYKKKKPLPLQDRKDPCDVLISINETPIFAHKDVLIATSKYFFWVFKTLGEKKVTFECVDKNIFMTLIDFCYTGKTETNMEKVESLIKSANYLSMYSFLGNSSKALGKTLDASNCLTYLKLTKHGNMKGLKQACFETLEKNFVEIAESEGFLSLDFEDVNEIFMSSKLSLIMIAESLKNWISQDVTSRLKNLLNYLNDDQSDNELVNALYKIFFLYNKNHVHLTEFIEGLKLQKSIESACNYVINESKKLTTIIAVGGNHPMVVAFIEFYDLYNEQWVEFSAWPNDKYCCNSTVIDDKVFLIGGFCAPYVCFICNLTTEIMTTSNLRYPRLFSSVSPLNNEVIVAGGVYPEACNGSTSVEKFSLETGLWVEIANMNIKRYGHGAAVLNDEIYVVGGMGWRGSEVAVDTSTVEKYNSVNDRWTICKSLNEGRYMPAVGVFEGRLYVVGGKNAIYTLLTVERYDAEADVWTTIRSMDVPIDVKTVGVFMNKFIISGDMGGSNHYVTVAYYRDGDSWKPMGPLSRYRGYFNLIEVSWNMAEIVIAKARRSLA